MGALIGAISLLIAGISFGLLFTTPIAMTTFLYGLLGSGSLCTAALVFHLTAALKNASCYFQEGALTLRWGGLNIHLPTQLISHVVSGRDQTITHFQGIRWPGYCLGRGQIIFEDQPLPTLFLATGGIATQWVIITPHQAIAFSPQKPAQFTSQLPPTTSPPKAEMKIDFSFWGWPIWSDRWYWALVGTAAAINLLLLALLCTIYPQLPIPFTATQNLFLWPLLAAACWLFNNLLGGWFHQQRQEPFMAYLFASGTIIIQVTAVFITLNIFIG